MYINFHLNINIISSVVKLYIYFFNSIKTGPKKSGHYARNRNTMFKDSHLFIML